MKSFRDKAKLKKTVFLIFLILSVAVATLIFYFSHQNSDNSVDTSKGFTTAVIGAVMDIFTDLTEMQKTEVVENVHNGVRVFAHFFAFLVLSFFVSGTFLSSNIKKNIAYKQFLSVITSFLYAVSDEIHQYFIPGRAFQFFDIVVDFLGVLLGWLIMKTVYGIFIKKRNLKNIKNTIANKV